MEKKNFLWWIEFVLLCIWQLPQLLIALIMWPFLGEKTLIADRHHNLCYKGENMSGGISLGPIAYVSKYLAKKPEGISHEVDGHTYDSKMFGPLYLFIIGIPSIVWAWLYNSKKHCYYDFYTEKRANRWAGLEVDKYCNLKFKK